MAMFSYACGDCGLTYEVARDLTRADDEAYCPICGLAIRRVRRGTLARVQTLARRFVHGHGDGPGQHRHW